MLSIVKEKNKLFFFFHLALLILKKSNLVEYIFSYEHIEEIYKIVQNEKKNELLAFIYSKILIELISYFKDTKKYKENKDKDKDKEKVLDEMLSLCYDKIYKIDNSLKIFNQKDLNKDIIKNLGIDEVYYMTVINELKKRDLRNFNDLHEIQLIIIDIIYVDNTMLNKLQKLLNKNDKYFKKNTKLRIKVIYQVMKILI